MKGNVENKNNSPVDIRFVAKTSDTKNLSENIGSDVQTSEVATLTSTVQIQEINSRLEVRSIDYLTMSIMRC